MNDKCQCPAEAGAATCELAEPRSAVPCPRCRRAGKAVDTITVKAMLAVSLMELRGGDYRFCRTADCPVVYYNADGQQFAEPQLRECVFQKHPGDYDVFICYCFRHTRRSISDELASGSSTVVAAITAGIQAKQCACDIRNPQGSCCLGNVRAAVQEAAS